MKSYEQTIFSVLREIATQRNPELPPLEKSQTLTYDLGLRSLDLAQLVATLELELHADPFAQLVPITSVRTVGDVCEAYRLYFEEQPQLLPRASGGQDGARGLTRPRVPNFANADLRRQTRGRETG
jgi:hypothetical protein